jgi:hypothetical protein
MRTTDGSKIAVLAAHDPALTFHRDVHLFDPIHRIVFPMHLTRVGDQLLSCGSPGLTVAACGRPDSLEP